MGTKCLFFLVLDTLCFWGPSFLRGYQNDLGILKYRKEHLRPGNVILCGRFEVHVPDFYVSVPGPGYVSLDLFEVVRKEKLYIETVSAT